MISLEKFIEDRMRQSEFQAMMIPRYLNNPDAFIGKNTHTLEQANEFQKEAEKCKATLKFLSEYKKSLNP